MSELCEFGATVRHKFFRELKISKEGLQCIAAVTLWSGNTVVLLQSILSEYLLSPPLAIFLSQGSDISQADFPMASYGVGLLEAKCSGITLATTYNCMLIASSLLFLGKYNVAP